MDYRWKDLFITIVPGATLLGMLYAIYCIGGCDRGTPIITQLVQPFSITSISDTFYITCLLLYVGFMVNIIASIIERVLHFKDTDEKSQNERHQKMVEVGPSQLIEEHFVHYAMARNMLASHVFCEIILLFSCCLCGCTGKSCVMLFYLFFSIFLLYKSYKRYLKRYKEVINEEYDHMQKNKVISE